MVDITYIRTSFSFYTIDKTLAYTKLCLDYWYFGGTKGMMIRIVLNI
jgi:hypothetical protein